MDKVGCDYTECGQKCNQPASMSMRYDGKTYFACCYQHALHAGGEYPRCDYEDHSSFDERCSYPAVWRVENAWPFNCAIGRGPGQFCMEHVGHVLRLGYEYRIYPIKEIFDPKPSTEDPLSAANVSETPHKSGCVGECSEKCCDQGDKAPDRHITIEIIQRAEFDPAALARRVAQEISREVRR